MKARHHLGGAIVRKQSVEVIARLFQNEINFRKFYESNVKVDSKAKICPLYVKKQDVNCQARVSPCHMQSKRSHSSQHAFKPSYLH